MGALEEKGPQLSQTAQNHLYLQLLQLLKNSPREVKRAHFRYIMDPPWSHPGMEFMGPGGEGPSRSPPVSPAMITKYLRLTHFEMLCSLGTNDATGSSPHRHHTARSSRNLFDLSDLADTPHRSSLGRAVTLTPGRLTSDYGDRSLKLAAADTTLALLSLPLSSLPLCLWRTAPGRYVQPQPISKPTDSLISLSGPWSQQHVTISSPLLRVGRCPWPVGRIF